MATHKEGMHIKQRKWKRKQLGVWAKQKVKERRKNGQRKRRGGGEEEEKEAARCSGYQLGCSILFEGVQYFNIYIKKKKKIYCIFVRTHAFF